MVRMKTLLRIVNSIRCKKWLICLFLGLSSNAVKVFHVVIFVYILDTSIIVSYYGWLQRFSILITEIIHCWWRKHVYMSFVLPLYGCQVILNLVTVSSCFIFHFCPVLSGIAFLCGLTVQWQFIVAGVVIK